MPSKYLRLTPAERKAIVAGDTAAAAARKSNNPRKCRVCSKPVEAGRPRSLLCAACNKTLAERRAAERAARWR